jgi:hypothetical protein
MAAIATAARLFPNLTLNAVVHFQNETFTICRELVNIASPGFSQQKGFPYHIRSNVPESSVVAFLKPFRLCEPDITLENANDLLVLSVEFAASSYRCEFETLLRNNGRSAAVVLIGRLQEGLCAGEDVSEIETDLQANFFEVIDDARLLEVPLSVLMRVVPLGVSGEADKRERLFGFCLRVFDRIGPASSVLFAGLDAATLTSGNLVALKDRPGFLWNFLGEALCDSLLQCLSSNAESRRQLDESHALCESLREDCCRLLDEAVVGVEKRISGVEVALRSFADVNQVQQILSCLR